MTETKAPIRKSHIWLVVLRAVAKTAELPLGEISRSDVLGDDLGIGETIGRAEFLDLADKICSELGISSRYVNDMPKGRWSGKLTVEDVLDITEEALKSECVEITQN